LKSIPPPQVPPPGASFRSKMAVFNPAFAKSRAATNAEGPPPTMATSRVKPLMSFSLNLLMIAEEMIFSADIPEILSGAFFRSGFGHVGADRTIKKI
jgi:hypothetical protein